MHTIKITPNLLFKYQCTSGKFIRLPNQIESKKSIRQRESNRIELKLFCRNWNALAVTVWPQIAMQICGTPFPILGRGGRSGSTIVPFERVMVCSYRLSIVTISLSLMAAICNTNSKKWKRDEIKK